ncbi:MAG: hypothetical protein ACFE9Q_09640 [Candidatus Hodarchaeota archaeon]
MTEDALRNKIRELKLELEKKNQEIEHLDDIIEELQDKIIELENLKKLEEGATKKSKKILAAESRFAYELEEKDRQIRDLKNNMGFLRKEKVQLQQELERLKTKKNSSVIRVEDLRSKSPLNVLVKDLQEEVNKQRSIINRLMSKSASSEDLSEKLNQKDKEIEILRNEISDLNEKLKYLGSYSGDKTSDSITKKLIEDLQNQLTKAKRQVVELKQKLEKSNKESEKEELDNLKSTDFNKEIIILKENLERKDKEIKKLENDILSLQKADNAVKIDQIESPSDDMIKALKEDLQNKLNRSKLQIQSLQEQLKIYKSGTSTESGNTQKELEGKLKMQREMAIFLKKQLETKEGEIETIKNEAVQIKAKYRQLENQSKIKDQKLSELQRQLDTLTIQTQIQPKREDPDLTLRVRELKNKVDHLRKLTNEQRIEISHLRKKI